MLDDGRPHIRISRTMEKKLPKLVAEHFGVAHEDLIRGRVHRPTRQARDVAMYLLKLYTSRSFSAIGRPFGSEHTNVLLAIRAVERDMEQDPEFRKQVKAIAQRLTRTKAPRGTRAGN